MESRFAQVYPHYPQVWCPHFPHLELEKYKKIYNYACDESQYNITLIVIGVLHTNNNEYYYFCNKSKIDDNGNRESRVGSSAIKRKI